MSGSGRKFKDPSYPDGGPYIDETLGDYHARKWLELDTIIKGEAVDYLKASVAAEVLGEWRQIMLSDPDHWMFDHHFFAGMSYRNLLRKKVFDTRLPTGNWDDYWAACLEAACGVRPT